jgi:hypothetical protein
MGLTAQEFSAMVRWVAIFEASKPGSFTASAIGPGRLSQPLKNISNAAALNNIVFRFLIGLSTISLIPVNPVLVVPHPLTSSTEALTKS